MAVRFLLAWKPSFHRLPLHLSLRKNFAEEFFACLPFQSLSNFIKFSSSSYQTGSSRKSEMWLRGLKVFKGLPSWFSAMSDLILRPCLQIVSIGRIRFARIGYGIRIELRFATLARSSSSSSSFENSSLHWSSIVAEVSIILRITARLCICLSLSLSLFLNGEA